MDGREGSHESGGGGLMGTDWAKIRKTRETLSIKGRRRMGRKFGKFAQY